MKYNYRTDTYSGDPLPESEATLMVYFDQVVEGIPVLCGAAEASRATPVQTAGRRSGITAPSPSRRG